MKKFKKILSLALSIMLVLSAVAVIPAGAAEAETSENLIINGDIEGELNGSWNWSPGKTQEYKYEGESALIISGGSNPWQNVFQKVAVKPYTSYTFSFWYYLPDGANWRTNWYINGIPADLDGSNPVGYFEDIASTIHKGSVAQCEEGVWKQASVTFDSDTNEAVLIDFYSGGDSMPIRFYVDNVSLTENENSDNGKIVKNGGFENGADYWGAKWYGLGDVNKGDSKIVSDTVHTGTYAGHVASGWNQYIWTKVNVLPNTDYILKFYTVKAAGVNLAVSPTMNNSDDQFFRDGHVPEGIIINQGITDSDDWIENKVRFNSGENKVLYIAFYNPYEGSGNIRIDDISMEVDPYNGKIIKNGGFEDGDDYWGCEWLDMGSADEWGGRIVSDKVRTGTYSGCVVSGYNHYIWTKVNVSPNTDYILKFYTVNAAGVNLAVSPTIDQNNVSMFRGEANTPEGTIINQGITNSDDWIENKVRFNSGENKVLYIAFYNPYEGSGNIRIDDISMEVDPYNGKIVKNGGFESGSEFWNTGGGEISKEEHYEGTASLKLATKQYNKATQKLSVKANTDYVISYYHKGNKYSRWGVSTAEGQVEANSRIVGGDIYNTNGEWVRTSAFFNSGENTTVYFNIMSGSDDVEIYIDNVSLDLVAAGDANGDGLINAVDLTVLKQVLLGFNTNHSTVGCRVRGEDECDIRDLIRLKKELA